MSKGGQLCPGQCKYLEACSKPIPLYKLFKGLWLLKNKGLRTTVKHSLDKLKNLVRKRKGRAKKVVKKSLTATDEVLNLKPGEWVEVKSEEEILATLDRTGRYKGLAWMPGMEKFCGKRFRVYKKLSRILLESTGELRKLKNTVLLENAQCDGKEFFDCDRSCYYYWKEIWLRRLEVED